MRVLIACEFSGVGREAFRALGHDAWSCDLLPAEDNSSFHLQCDVLTILNDGWDLMLAHPECTYLARSGWRWVNAPDQSFLPLKGRPRLEAAQRGVEFFMKLLNAPIDKRAIENPRPSPHVKLPRSNQVIQPWMFGHGETKETHLWLKNLPPLMSTLIVSERAGKVHRAPPGPNRWKDRARSYPGILKAMAEQWS